MRIRKVLAAVALEMVRACQICRLGISANLPRAGEGESKNPSITSTPYEAVEQHLHTNRTACASV